MVSQKKKKKKNCATQNSNFSHRWKLSCLEIFLKERSCHSNTFFIVVLVTSILLIQLSINPSPETSMIWEELCIIPLWYKFWYVHRCWGRMRSLLVSSNTLGSIFLFWMQLCAVRGAWGLCLEKGYAGGKTWLQSKVRIWTFDRTQVPEADRMSTVGKTGKMSGYTKAWFSVNPSLFPGWKGHAWLVPFYC